jgi:hypothetical protein
MAIVYDFTVTEISRRNGRSLRAHRRVGFECLYDYPARTFHEPATATANHHAVARSAPVCQLNVEQTTPSLPNSPRTAPRRALGGLATHVHETSGLDPIADDHWEVVVWDWR